MKISRAKNRPRHVFSQEEKDFISNNYPRNGAKFCEEALNLKSKTVGILAHRMGLKVDADVVRKNRSLSRLKYKNFNSYAVNPENFFNIKTPEIAYLLGFLWADGYCDTREGKLSVAFLKDDFERIKPVFEFSGKWRVYFQKVRGNRKPSVCVETSNRPLTDWLYKIGFRSRVLGATSILSLIPDNLRYYWWRGFSDGDGSFTMDKISFKNKGFCLTGPVNQNWNFAETLFLQIGATYSIKKYTKIFKNGKTHQNSTIRLTSCPSIRAFGGYIYPNNEFDGIGFPRKFTKYIKILEASKNTKVLNRKAKNPRVYHYYDTSNPKIPDEKIPL